MPKSHGEARIVVSKNGSYLLSGAVPLARQTIVANDAGASHAWKEGAAVAAPDSDALCRCGRSANKPCCDGTHAVIKFTDTDQRG